MTHDMNAREIEQLHTNYGLELERKNKTIAELREQINVVADVVAGSAKRQYEQHESERQRLLSALDDERKHFREQLDERNALIDALRAQAVASDKLACEQLRATMTERDELRTRADSFERALDDAARKLSTTTGDLYASRNAVDELTDILAQRDTQIAQLLDTIDSSTREFAALQAELDAAHRSDSRRVDELRTLRAQLDVETTEHAHTSAELYDVRAERDEALSERNALSVELLRTQQQLTSAASSLELRDSQIAEDTSALVDARFQSWRLRATVAEQQQQLQELRAQLDDARCDADDAKRDLSTVRDLLQAEHEREQRALRIEIDDALRDLERQSKAAAIILDERDQLRAAVVEYERTAQSTRDDYWRQVARAERAESERDECGRTVSSQRDTIKALRDELVVLSGDLDNARQQRERAYAYHQGELQAVRNVLSERDSQIEQLKLLRDELVTQLRAEIDILRAHEQHDA